MPRTVEVCNLTAGQSIYRVAREIRRQEHSAFNCLCSIAEDASFVNEISVLYPGNVGNSYVARPQALWLLMDRCCSHLLMVPATMSPQGQTVVAFLTILLFVLLPLAA